VTGLVDSAKCLFVLVDWICIRVVVGRFVAAVGAAAAEVRSRDMVVRLWCGLFDRSFER
jgi:hypothetical protein